MSSGRVGGRVGDSSNDPHRSRLPGADGATAPVGQAPGRQPRRWRPEVPPRPVGGVEADASSRPATADAGPRPRAGRSTRPRVATGAPPGPVDVSRPTPAVAAATIKSSQDVEAAGRSEKHERGAIHAERPQSLGQIRSGYRSPVRRIFKQRPHPQAAILAIHSAAGRSAPGPRNLERRLRTASGDVR